MKRFNSSGLIMGTKIKKAIVKSSHGDFNTTESYKALISRLSCGTRDCKIKSDNQSIKIVKWASCDTQGSIKQETGCGNLYFEVLMSGKYAGGAIGFRHENMNKFDTFIYHPRIGFKRKSGRKPFKLGGLELGSSKLTTKLPVIRINANAIAARNLTWPK